ncbi:(p)ppGpp synthetase [Diplocloster hominis]|uniref:GTP pyrophosphokinase n=1 Tax=Diplocloster hominis TaxID=3079010 RepID=UPI0031BA0324
METGINVSSIASDLREYEDFIQPYEDAVSIVQVWLETLDKDFQRRHKHNPIHSMQSRIKSLNSIVGKLDRKGIPVSFEAAKDYLTDIAGIRVICFYVQDVYTIVNILKKQMDIIMIKEKDYIADPKKNGYRSYHLVLGVTVYHAEGKQYYPVEIQIRTLAMDFWASMEHQLCYKAVREDKTLLSKELKECSLLLEEIEGRMERFYDPEAERER